MIISKGFFNFKNTSWFFIAVVLLTISLNIVVNIPLWIYFLLYLLYSGLFFYGCFVLKACFFSDIICFKNTQKKQVALSFDDGPTINFTADILAILRSYKLKATFFCIGKQIQNNPKILKQIHQQGHLIGNHSYSHNLAFTLFSAKKILEDMQRMDAVVEKNIGLKPKLFRPPFGVTNYAINKAIVKGGYTAIGWNVRSFDTRAKNKKKLLTKVVKAIKPGAIFLFHDTNEQTVAILPKLLQQLYEQGYQVVRLDKMLALEAYVKSI